MPSARLEALKPPSSIGSPGVDDVAIEFWISDGWGTGSLSKRCSDGPSYQTSRVMEKYDNDCPVLYSRVVKERKCWGQFRDPELEPENILTDLLWFIIFNPTARVVITPNKINGDRNITLPSNIIPVTTTIEQQN